MVADTEADSTVRRVTGGPPRVEAGWTGLRLGAGGTEMSVQRACIRLLAGRAGRGCTCDNHRALTMPGTPSIDD